MKRDTNIDIALLLIRLALAIVFFVQGFTKLADIGATSAAFTVAGLSVSWVYAMAGIELVGAFLMLVGGAVRWTGILLAVDLLAYSYIGGYPFDLVLFLTSIAIALSGPGAYAVERFFGETGKEKGGVITNYGTPGGRM